jgi:hypothetical protein
MGIAELLEEKVIERQTREASSKEITQAWRNEEFRHLRENFYRPLLENEAHVGAMHTLIEGIVDKPFASDIWKQLGSNYKAIEIIDGYFCRRSESYKGELFESRNRSLYLFGLVYNALLVEDLEGMAVFRRFLFKKQQIIGNSNETGYLVMKNTLNEFAQVVNDGYVKIREAVKALSEARALNSCADGEDVKPNPMEDVKDHDYRDEVYKMAFPLKEDAIMFESARHAFASEIETLARSLTPTMKELSALLYSHKNERIDKLYPT